MLGLDLKLALFYFLKALGCFDMEARISASCNSLKFYSSVRSMANSKE
jgi:hypothetical protein